MLSRWQSTIVDAQGNVQPHAVLRIRKEQDQSLALVYRSNSDLQPYPLGMVAADINGFVYFYAPPGRYRIQSIDLDIDWRDVEIGALSTARAALEHSGMTVYDTHADMMADAPSESPVYARVVNDADPGLNGYYIWDSSTWERTTSQPADADNVLYRNTPQSAPLLHDIPQSGVVQLPADLDYLRTAALNALYGDGPYPTLDLRFAGAKMLDPRVDFSRASTATGTGPTGRIYTAAIDEPRFVYDPATGQSEGLLVEGQATNLCRRSNSFGDTSIWPRYGGITITSGFEPSPVEGEWGSRLQVEPGTDARIDQVIAVSEGEQITLSFWAKIGPEAATSNLQIFDPESWGNKNISTTPGWRRFVFTGVVPTGETTFIVRFRRPSMAGLDVVIAGVQVEVGGHPSSYIPTKGSQVTRIADTPIIPVGDWFNPDEGTFVVEGEAQPRGTSDDQNRATLLKVGDSIASTDGLVIDRAGETNDYIARTRTTDGGYTVFGLGNSSGIVKIAMAYTAGGDMRGAMNGGDVVTNTNNWDGTGDFLYIGAGGLDGVGRPLRRVNGPISRVTYYPRALSNEQLQALTS